MTVSIAASAEGLTRQFGATQALVGLDFDVPSGEVFGVLGHNGAGKTTMIRLLNGLITPTSGRMAHRNPARLCARCEAI